MSRLTPIAATTALLIPLSAVAAHAAPPQTDDWTCYTAEPAAGSDDLSYAEATSMIDPAVLQDRYGHSSAWADVNNDQLPDLFLGTYAAYPNLEFEGYLPTGPYKPDQLLINTGSGFVKDETFPDDLAWTSGIAFADFDNDGDLDLMRSRYGQDNSNQETAGESDVLRNDNGRFSIVAGAISRDIDARTGGRSVAVVDYDADGYLDVFLTQDRNGGSSSSLLSNPGTWSEPWRDVTAEAGLPNDIEGFSVSADDLTGDGHADLFIVGQNRLFVADGDGTFHESSAALPPPPRAAGFFDHYTGVSAADLNRDGRDDLLIGAHHVSWIWGATDGVPPARLLINRGNNAAGDPVFTEETAQAGLPTSVRAKSATVHVVDIDNDGHPDIMPGVGQDSDSQAYFHNTGVVDADGVPQFEVPANIGTTPGLSRPNEPQAWVGAPVADFDLDGRQDVFLDYFFNPDGNHLQRNTTASGHWLAVSIDSRRGTGPGTEVAVYEEGHLGESEHLVATRTITATEGYVSGVPSEARFGLGGREAVDVRVTMPPGSPAQDAVVDLRSVPADQHLRLPEGCHADISDIREFNGVSVTDMVLDGDLPLSAGESYPVRITMTRQRGGPAVASVGVDAPAGWTTTRETVTLEPNRPTTVEVLVTPPADDVAIATLVADVRARPASGPGTVVTSGWPSVYRVQSIPDADSFALALDAGEPESPVLDGFSRLSPDDTWVVGRAAGWSVRSPDARDRGSHPDPGRLGTDDLSELDALRRDFAYGTEPRELILQLPPGEHEVLMLTGDDINPTHGFTVSVDGVQVADADGTEGPRVYEWVRFVVDGGPTGRTVSLRIAGKPGNGMTTPATPYWIVNAVLVR